MDNDNNKIIIKYKIKYKERIRLFGYKFIKENKNKCKLEANGIIEELKEYYENEQILNNEEVEIKLIGINDITNISYMFYGCSTLIGFKDILKLNIKNIINMNSIFYGCSSLGKLPDISMWNTNSVKDMNNLFYGCSSLKSLPDISKWKTNNVKDMNSSFY